MTKRVLPITVLLFLLLAATAFGQQTALPAGATQAAETTTPAPTISPPSEEDPVVLVWEGDPLADDNQDECRTLQVTASGQATVGPCSAADTPVELFTSRPGEWTEMAIRFAPFEAETEQGRIVFQGQGQISSPAWERAIAAWARFSYLELSSGRVSASARTILSWWLGELPDQPGLCRHLVVLVSGYAYSNITPCEDGQVQETVGGWLDTAEWDKFDSWLYSYGELYQDNNYFTGQAQDEMSPAETAVLADWANAVYARLRIENPLPQAEAGGCPEPATGEALLENEQHGYCLLYPAEYTIERPNDSATVLVIDSLLNVSDPRLHIELADTEGRTLAGIADQVAADYSIPGMEIERSQVTVGGEEALVLDKLPGQDINRRVLFTHNGRLYNLMFSPASEDAGETYERMEQLYSLVLNSFTFLE